MKKPGFWKGLWIAIKGNVPRIVEDTAESVNKNAVQPAIFEFRTFLSSKVTDDDLLNIIINQVDSLELKITQKIDQIYKGDNA